MQNFLRRIRHRLITKNKIKKYIFYAIGEIILVVIGILIALQINNWNENQQLKNIEEAYLQNLKEEIVFNIEQLEKVMNVNENNASKALQLMEFTGKNSSELSKEKCNSLLAETLIWEVQFRPSTGVYNEIISSGKLGIFRNPQLRKMLAGWDGLIMKIRFQEQEHSTLRSNALDMIHQKGNIRSIYYQEYSEGFEIKSSNFEKGNIVLLKNQEFENQISSFYMTSQVLNEVYYSDLKNNLYKLLDLVQNELGQPQA